MGSARSDSSAIYDRWLDLALAGKIEDPREFLRREGVDDDDSIARGLENLRRGLATRPDAASAHEVGREFGEYRVVRRLGGGGMGDVYLARSQSRLGRFVAVKTMRAEHRASPDLIERFSREARILARLSHPNIVAIHGFGEDPAGILFIAMELLPGRSLAELLSEAASRPARALAPGEVLAWGAQIARGLAAAHDAGILHRDVKPSNIRIEELGRAVLVDFGLARSCDSGLPTLTAGFIGTPAYASPEQLTAPSRSLDGRTDVYSLGVTLFECLTGRRPFDGADVTEIVGKILTQPPPSPRSLAPHISAELESLLVWSLAKDPEDRPASAAALGAALERLE